MNFKKYYFKFKIYSFLFKNYISNIYNGIFNFKYKFPVLRRITGLFEITETERKENEKGE
jgi:hypothetical protein